jgi:ketosteroid isomerase-like protein
VPRIWQPSKNCTRKTSKSRCRKTRKDCFLWTKDGVLLEPGSPPVVGKQAIQIYNEKGHTANPGFKVLNYEPTFKEIQITDGWAYEWGETDAKFTMSAEGPPVSLHIKGVRVLRQQTDGSWKMALTIWTQ